MPNPDLVNQYRHQIEGQRTKGNPHLFPMSALNQILVQAIDAEKSSDTKFRFNEHELAFWKALNQINGDYARIFATLLMNSPETSSLGNRLIFLDVRSLLKGESEQAKT